MKPLVTVTLLAVTALIVYIALRPTSHLIPSSKTIAGKWLHGISKDKVLDLHEDGTFQEYLAPTSVEVLPYSDPVNGRLAMQDAMMGRELDWVIFEGNYDVSGKFLVLQYSRRKYRYNSESMQVSRITKDRIYFLDINGSHVFYDRITEVPTVFSRKGMAQVAAQTDRRQTGGKDSSNDLWVSLGRRQAIELRSDGTLTYFVGEIIDWRGTLKWNRVDLYCKRDGEQIYFAMEAPPDTTGSDFFIVVRESKEELVLDVPEWRRRDPRDKENLKELPRGAGTVIQFAKSQNLPEVVPEEHMTAYDMQGMTISREDFPEAMAKRERLLAREGYTSPPRR